MHVLQLAQTKERCLVLAIDDAGVRRGEGRDWKSAVATVEASGLATFDSELAHRLGEPQRSRATTEEEQILRASVAWSLANGLGDEHRAKVHPLLIAWRAFVDAALWDTLKAEVGLRVRKLDAPEGLVGCIAVLGHGGSGDERGLAFYEDATSFDALWSGEPGRIDGLSLLVDPENPLLRLAFDALGVPPPVLIAVEDSQPRAPSLDELALAEACLRVLLGAAQPLLELQT